MNIDKLFEYMKKCNSLSDFTVMKRRFLLGLISLFFSFVAFAQTNEKVVSGIVKDKKTNKVLPNVNVSVKGSNIGTITNEDGVFVLKLAEVESGLVFSHLNYQNSFIPASQVGESGGNLTVKLEPSSLTLREVNVYGGNPRELVEMAIRKIDQNYTRQKQLYSAFYRETIQKRRRYIEISEVFMDVFKTGYQTRMIHGDKVRLLKGRRLASQKLSDTLAVRISGGPTLPLYLDVVKNSEELLSVDLLPCYHFSMEPSTTINNRMQYVVRFRPLIDLDYALYKGLIFIDQESLSFTRTEFELDMSDKEKAVKSILQKKPNGLRFRPSKVSFVVSYKQQGDKTYLNYISNEIRFKCDWKKRLFSSTYVARSEMVMVDREDNPSESIRNKEAFRRRQVLHDVVDAYWQPDFWNDYNIIEPSESLESGTNKLKKKK